MTKKREKTKSSQTKEESSPLRGGTPVAHFATPSHRIPGQPVGINYTVDRSKFDPGFHPADFVKHCQEGATRYEIAAAWGIGAKTLDTWLDKHKEMKEIFDIGVTAQKAWVAKKARGAIERKDVNTVALIFTAKNMISWGDDPQNDFPDAQQVEVDFVFNKKQKS